MARVAQLFGNNYGKGIVLLFVFVRLCWVNLRMCLFGAAKDHNGPRAISKI